MKVPGTVRKLPAGFKILSLIESVYTSPGTHLTSHSVGTGDSFSDSARLKPRIRMSGDIPPFRHTTPRRVQVQYCL
jgi:hypothetical protein